MMIFDWSGVAYSIWLTANGRYQLMTTVYITAMSFLNEEIDKTCYGKKNRKYIYERIEVVNQNNQIRSSIKSG